LSAVYRFASLDAVESVSDGQVPGFIYARDAHPNASEFAAKIAAIEHAEAALVCASGMGAIAALLLSTLEQGDHVAVAGGVYGKTALLVNKELARFGISSSQFDATQPESLRAALTDRTRLVLAETISNPLVRVADIPALGKIAAEKGAMLAIDNTFAPLLCRPLELGAQVVFHSVTKLIGGHSDLLLGVLAGPKAFIERASSLASTFGMTGGAFESWLALRGLATLPVRSSRACATAQLLAYRLAAHPKVKTVHHPALSHHPDHARARQLLQGGFGAMGAIDLGSRNAADVFIRSLHHIPFAPSLGDVSTTLSHPSTTSHRSLPADEAARQGITPGLVRLSFGLEDPEDLWHDFEQALHKVGEAKGGA
jgi:cystathionine beta-lyase/cystathionine gamma-synthase